MIRFADWLGHWSVDVYLLASVSLVIALLAMAALRQPVHRLAVVKSLMIGLGLLAALCAVPNWSVLHLMATNPEVRDNTVRTVAPAPSTTVGTLAAPTGERRPVNIEPISPPAPQVETPSRLNIQPWIVFGEAELIGALSVVIWLACGWAIARNLCHRSYATPFEVEQLLSLVARAAPFNSNYVPKILASDRIDVPVALGLRWPIIVLPSRMIAADSASAVSQSELSTVLAHELAHVHNRDLYWLALSRGLLLFFWSHPLYWLARRQMRLDQESLADAAAAELTSREQYAEQLVGWARTLTNARTMRLASAVGLWEGASQLRQRVALLLDERITILRQFSRKWQLATLGICTIVAAALSLVTLQPGQTAPPAGSNLHTPAASASLGTGNLTLRFEYDGQPPEPKQLKEWIWRDVLDKGNLANIDLVKRVGAKVFDESLVVGKDRGIANIFVWVRSQDIPVPPVAELPRPSVSFSKGRYEPHAQAFQAPRHVILRNDDAKNANIFDFTSFSVLIQPIAQKEVEVVPNQPSIPTRLTSHVYPWVNAWVLPAAHPFVAVSDAEGKIRISDLPPGKWEFQVWHERPGYLKTPEWQRGRFTLEIKPGENDLGTIKLSPNIFRWNAGLRSIQDWARPDLDANTGNAPASDQRATVEGTARSSSTDERRLTPNTVTGQALNEHYEPVAGAAAFAVPQIPRSKPNQLAGQVLDAKHMPIANVEISVFRLRQSDATRKLVTTLKTDKNGEYRVDNFIDLAKEFPDGKFPPLRGLGDEYLQIIARTSGYASQSQLDSIQNVAQFGDAMLMILQPAVSVRGKVTDADGKPIAGALVSLGTGPELLNWSGANSAQADADGNYVIEDAAPYDPTSAEKGFKDPAISNQFVLVEVPPALTVSRAGYATKQGALAKAPGTQDFQLERPAIIEGTVVYGDSGKPASNVLVQARSKIDGPSVASNSRFPPIIQTTSVRTDAKGKYRIESLPQGKYDLWAEADQWTNSGLVIRAGSGEINHVFDLKLTRGGVISVRLVDADTGKPIPVEKDMTAMITASPMPYGIAGHVITQSNILPTTDGRFELHAPPGKMAVSSLYMEDGVARHWLSQGKPVETEVVDGQTVQIDLPVKDTTAGHVARNVNSPYAPENQPAAGPFKGVIPAPALAPPGAVPVFNPALHPPVALPPAAIPPSASTSSSPARYDPNTPEHSEPNTVSGRAYDEHDQPIAGAEIFLFRVQQQDGTRKLVAQMVTDAAGRFRFDSVLDIPKEFPDGKFPPPYLPDDNMPEAVVRAPGRITSTWLMSRTVIARSGYQARLQMLPAATLRGRVTDASSKPVAGALVSVSYGAGSSNSPTHVEGAQSGRTDANGNYIIDDIPQFDEADYKEQVAEADKQTNEQLARGVHTFRLSPAPPLLTVKHPDHAVKQVRVDKCPGTTDVQLDPAATLVGRVTFADSGKPAAGVLVGAATSIAGRPKPATTLLQDFQRVAVRTDVDGKYRIASLPAGKYDVWADADGYVNEGENDAVASAGKEENVPNLKFTKGGRVRVRIVDAKSHKPITLPPETRAMLIALLPANSRPTGRPLKESWTTPNSAGQFELNLIPGKKLLGAAAVEIASQLKFSGESKTEVNILDGQTIDVDLPVTALSDAQ